MRIGDYTFEQVDYDERSDVLYVGRRGVGDGDTPEGHVWMYADDTSATPIGVALINARDLLERDGALIVTLPDGSVVDATEAAELVSA